MKEQKLSQRDVDTVAKKNYQPSAYKSNQEQDNGLAITHEQVNDTFVEGTIDKETDE